MRAKVRRGQIEKRSRSYYIVKVYAGRVAGRRKYRSQAVRGTLRDAQRALTELLRARDVGRIQEDSVGTRETVAAYLPRWLELHKAEIRATTLKSYEQLVRRYIVPRLGSLRLQRLRAADVQRFVNDLGNGKIGPRTVRYIVTVLHKAVRDAVRWGLLPVDPMERGTLKLPRLVRAEQKWLTGEQAQLLLGAARGDRLEALWHVAITTGVRPGELRALRWSDLDLEEGRLRVERAITLDGASFVEPKTKTSCRTIVLTVSALRTLKEHKRRQAEERLKAGSAYASEDLVFCTDRGRPLDHNNLVHHHFAKVLKQAGVPKVRLYDLRHTAATLALQAGVPLKVVSHMLGHAGIATTADVYSHVSPEMQAEAATRVERVLARANP